MPHQSTSVYFTKSLRALLFIGLFISVNHITFGQSTSSHIKKPVNKKLLAHLIKSGIDSVRVAHQLKEVVNDVILFNAAQHHAKYLTEIKRLSHQENTDKYKNPRDRAVAYGALNYLVAENIAMVPFNTAVKTKKKKIKTFYTYQQLAHAFVVAWVNSPGHYKNIITPSLEITGVAVSIDEKSNKVYAVQKFAEVLYQYQFFENKAFFEYSNYVTQPLVKSFDFFPKVTVKYPHKLKPLTLEKSEFDSLQQIIEGIAGHKTMEFDKRNIWIKMYLKAESLLAFLETNKDGLAIEVIEYTPFDCNNPEYYTQNTRRNKGSQLSDTLLIPIYRKKLIKGFKPRRKSTLSRIKKEFKKKDNERNIYEKVIDGIRMPYTPDKFKYKLGKLPKDITGYNEVNLVYIKDKQIVRVNHWSSACGQYYTEFHPLKSKRVKGKFTYIPVAPIKDYEFDFHFKKGKSNYSYQDLKPVLDSLTDDEFIILSADISAYSSVEGSEKLNLKIQKERSQSIIDAFQKKQSLPIAPNINAEINWPLFKNQIDSNEALAHLRGLNRTQLIDSLQNKNFTARHEEFLKEQRVAKVKIKTQYNLNDSTLAHFLLKEFERLVKKLERFEKEKKYKNFRNTLDTLVAIQEFSFLKVLDKKLPVSILHEFKHTSVHGSVNLYVNRYYYYEYFNIPKHKRGVTWEKLQLYSNKKNFHSIAAYNYLIKAIKNWDAKSKFNGQKADETTAIINKIARQNPELDTLVQKLKINFWFKTAEYFYGSDNWVKKDEYLTRIYAAYVGKVDENKALRLANFFIEFTNSSLAQDIITPFHKTENKEIIILIAKLSHFNSIENNSEKYADHLLELYPKLSNQEWCEMFVGECNISFQVFDSENLRKFYCDHCNEHKNIAQTPENWDLKK